MKDDAVFYMAANKIDVATTAVAQFEETAQANNVKFYQVSAKENTNVQQMFEAVIQDVSDQLEHTGNSE